MSLLFGYSSSRPEGLASLGEAEIVRGKVHLADSPLEETPTERASLFVEGGR